MMRKRLIAVVAALGLAALGVGAAFAIPAMAEAKLSLGSAPHRPDRQQIQQFQQDRQKQVREQLQSLVDDKTITADQADKVAAKLATQPGGRSRIPQRSGP